MSINGDFPESEYGDDYIDQEESLSDTTSERFDSKADKRAHHNALERKRRDHIKDSFSRLKNAVPTFSGEKVVASRAQILKKAAEYINSIRNKNLDHQRDIDMLKKENKLLEEKIERALEQMKGNGSSSSMGLAEVPEDEQAGNNKSEYGDSLDSLEVTESRTSHAIGIRTKKPNAPTTGQNSPSKRRRIAE